MRKIFVSFFIFTALLSARFTHASDLIFKKVSPHVFRVKTALAPNAPKASYGSGFVVDAEKGWIITNYHVVSDVVQKQNGFNNYVMIIDQPYEATIIALDLVHDLALLKVNYKFKEQISIRGAEPKQGEKIYSLGIPMDLNMSIVDGLFNGFRKVGPFDTMQMSTPINPGMSGGPTVDAEGRLVGVNVAGLFGLNNLTFAVPGEYVGRLIKVGKENPFPVSNFNALHARIEEQLLGAQTELVEASLKNTERAEIGNWVIPENSRIFKCWMVKKQQDLKPEARKVEDTERMCEVEHKVFIGDNGDTLNFSVNAIDLKNIKLNRFQFGNAAESIFNRWTVIQSPKVKERELEMSSYECETLQIWNEQKIPFLVSFCSRRYPRYPKLFETVFKMAVIDPKGKNTLLVRVKMDGFSPENTKKYLKEFVDHVSVKK